MTSSEIEHLHCATLRILDEIGVRLEHDEIVSRLLKAGARPGAKAQEVRFPPAMVQEYVALAPPQVELRARNGTTTLLAARSPAVFWTTPCMYLWTGSARREIKSADLAAIARLCDHLEAVQGVMGVAMEDVPPPHRDFVGLRVIAENCRKHARVLCFTPRGAEALVEMKRCWDGPWFSIGFTAHGPLRWTHLALDVFAKTAGHGIPATINGEPMAGATGPVSLAGTIAIGNAEILVITVDEYLKRLPKARRRALFAEWAPTLDRALNYIPRGTNGLVFNDPAKPHSPYGFTDTVGKTGELLFESLLYWTASKRLAARYLDGGDEKSAGSYSTRASMIETNLAALWDNQAGAFLATAKDCRQIDVWGNAYAIWLDFPLGAKRARVLQFLHDNRERYIWHGQVRHLLAGEHWQRLLTPVQPERYQNGAYWATASGWMMWSLAQSDRTRARQMWEDLIDDFKRGDVCECVNDGYRQLPSYVASATNPLAAARRLGF